MAGGDNWMQNLGSGEVLDERFIVCLDSKTPEVRIRGLGSEDISKYNKNHACNSQQKVTITIRAVVWGGEERRVGKRELIQQH